MFIERTGWDQPAFRSQSTLNSEDKEQEMGRAAVTEAEIAALSLEYTCAGCDDPDPDPDSDPDPDFGSDVDSDSDSDFGSDFGLEYV